MNDRQEEHWDELENPRNEFLIIDMSSVNMNLTPEDILNLKYQTGTMFFSSELPEPSLTYIGDGKLNGLEIGDIVTDDELFSYIPTATREIEIKGENKIIYKPKKDE